MPAYINPGTGMLIPLSRRTTPLPPGQEATIKDLGDLTIGQLGRTLVRDLDQLAESELGALIHRRAERLGRQREQRGQREPRGVVVKGLSLRLPTGLTEQEFQRLCLRCADLHDQHRSYRTVARIISRDVAVTDKTVQRWAEAGRRLR